MVIALLFFATAQSQETTESAIILEANLISIIKKSEKKRCYSI
jgi:hypothetical protein